MVVTRRNALSHEQSVPATMCRTPRSHADRPLVSRQFLDYSTAVSSLGACTHPSIKTTMFRFGQVCFAEIIA